MEKGYSNTIFVFWGPTACGKSTILKELQKIKPEAIVLDIVKYYEPYKNSQRVITQNNKLKAIEDLYRDVNTECNTFFLELGLANHDLHLQKLNYFSSHKIVHLFFNLDKNVCCKRAKQRNQRKDRDFIPITNFWKRMEIAYPDPHIYKADELGHQYHTIELDDKPVRALMPLVIEIVNNYFEK